MSIEATTYKQMIRSAFSGEIDYEGGQVMCSLHTDTYVPDPENDSHFNDLTGEVTGEGYTAGGTEAINSSLTLVDGQWLFDCDNPEWQDATIEDIRYIVFYMNEGDKPLLGYFDLLTGRAVENGIFRPVINEDGLMSIEIMI